MRDLAPMERCPYGRRGRHEFIRMVGDQPVVRVALFCAACGAVRMADLDADGPEPLDDMDADEIMRRAGALP